MRRALQIGIVAFFLLWVLAIPKLVPFFANASETTVWLAAFALALLAAILLAGSVRLLIAIEHGGWGNIPPRARTAIRIADACALSIPTLGIAIVWMFRP